MATADAFTGNTAWAREMPAALRNYLQTEAGSAFVLVAGALAPLPGPTCPAACTRPSGPRTCRSALALGDQRGTRRWVNDGLMTFFFFFFFFFFFVGLEVRRELDMGELRERRRVAVPVIAALGGMVAPALIYLAINAGRPGTGA